MKLVFADTHYLIARVNPKDQWHQVAKTAENKLGDFKIITTEGVLTEFLGAFSNQGSYFRENAIKFVREILNNTNFEVIPQTRDLFLKGLDFFEARADKKYSLVDCCSMVVMKEKKLTDVLTHDHHFEQEGFKILIKSEN